MDREACASGEENKCWKYLVHPEIKKIQQRRPSTIEHLRSYIRQKWDVLTLLTVIKVCSLLAESAMWPSVGEVHQGSIYSSPIPVYPCSESWRSAYPSKRQVTPRIGCQFIKNRLNKLSGQQLLEGHIMRRCVHALR